MCQREAGREKERVWERDDYSRSVPSPRSNRSGLLTGANRKHMTKAQIAVSETVLLWNLGTCQFPVWTDTPIIGQALDAGTECEYGTPRAVSKTRSSRRVAEGEENRQREQERSSRVWSHSISFYFAGRVAARCQQSANWRQCALMFRLDVKE